MTTIPPNQVSNHWKLFSRFFQSLETFSPVFPIIGKSHPGFSNHWKLFSAIALLFFFSGTAALMLQVIWVKQLTLLFGVSGHAVALTLSIFMLGLALGAHAGGRLAEHTARPLLLFALAEAALAATARLTTFLSPLVERLIQNGTINPDETVFRLFHALSAVVFLLPPAVLMGTTLPLLVRQCILLEHHVARRSGLLYAFNTAGGVMGCLAAGFILIGRFGLHGSLNIAVAINATVALLALAAAWIHHTPQSFAPHPRNQLSPPSTARARSMLIAFFLAGLSGLAVECVWSRMLLFHLNSTAQTFSAMLAVLLSSMALGSFAGARHAGRSRNPAARYGLILMSAALGMVLCLAIWAHLTSAKSFSALASALFSAAPAAWQTPLLDFLLRILIPALILTAPPAFLLGAAFPFAAEYFTDNPTGAARRFGNACMVNTLGCMSGPLLAGFLLLPHLGMQHTLLLCTGALLAAGCIARAGARAMKPRQAAVLIALFAGAALLLPERILFSLFSDRALYTDTTTFEHQRLVIVHPGDNHILFHQEDPCGTVLVMEQHIPAADLKQRRLYVGPTSMITDNFAAQRYTKLIGHLPVLLAEHPQRALVICLGTGMTLSGVAAHEQIEQLDCAELSPAVTRAVHCYDHVNGRVMEDPRLNLIIHDGRTHLLRTRENYDVIALEPPPPANDGAAHLYSREFYQHCFERLSEGGALSQWLPFHLIQEQELRTLTATMLEVFPTVLLWELYPATEYCLIGLKQQGPIPLNRMSDRLATQGLRDALAPLGIRNAADLFNGFLAGTDALRRLADSAPIVTDDHPRIGYNLTNLGLLTEYTPQALAMRNTLFVLQHKEEINVAFNPGDETAFETFLTDYLQVRAAYLMDRKLTLIATLGIDAYLQHFDLEQTLLPPPELDPGHPLYRTRPQVILYIQAFNRLAAHHEKNKDLNRAFAARLAVSRLKTLLPPDYLQSPPQFVEIRNEQ